MHSCTIILCNFVVAINVLMWPGLQLQVQLLTFIYFQPEHQLEDTIIGKWAPVKLYSYDGWSSYTQLAIAIAVSHLMAEGFHIFNSMFVLTHSHLYQERNCFDKTWQNKLCRFIATKSASSSLVQLPLVQKSHNGYIRHLIGIAVAYPKFFCGLQEMLLTCPPLR